jgi:hypothetical protein
LLSRKITYYRRLDSEVHIWWDVTEMSGGPQGRQFARNDADDVTTLIKQWSATVAGLDRRGELNHSSIVANARQGADG